MLSLELHPCVPEFNHKLSYGHQLQASCVKAVLAEKMSGDILVGIVALLMRKRITYTSKEDEQQVKNPKASQHEELAFVFF